MGERRAKRRYALAATEIKPRAGEGEMRAHPYLSTATQLRTLVPNQWDVLAIPLVFSVIFALAIGFRQMAAPVEVLQTTAVTLSPWNLPEYALRTVLRM